MLVQSKSRPGRTTFKVKISSQLKFPVQIPIAALFTRGSILLSCFPTRANPRQCSGRALCLDDKEDLFCPFFYMQQYGFTGIKLPC
jgi:hypothetical protein